VSTFKISRLQAAIFDNLSRPKRKKNPAERLICPLGPLGPLVGSICVKDLKKEIFRKLRKSELSDILHFLSHKKAKEKFKKITATAIDFNYMSPICSFGIIL
jgi:hypothetical protein